MEKTNIYNHETNETEKHSENPVKRSEKRNTFGLLKNQGNLKNQQENNPALSTIDETSETTLSVDSFDDLQEDDYISSEVNRKRETFGYLDISDSIQENESTPTDVNNMHEAFEFLDNFENMYDNESTVALQQDLLKTIKHLDYYENPNILATREDLYKILESLNHSKPTKNSTADESGKIENNESLMNLGNPSGRFPKTNIPFDSAYPVGSAGIQSTRWELASSDALPKYIENSEGATNTNITERTKSIANTNTTKDTIFDAKKTTYTTDAENEQNLRRQISRKNTLLDIFFNRSNTSKSHHNNRQ